jgi:hypothetical protein
MFFMAFFVEGYAVSGQQKSDYKNQTLYRWAIENQSNPVMYVNEALNMPISDLKKLTNDSSLIIVGWIRSNRAYLASDGNRVESEYKVLIQGILKGNLKAGNIVNLSVLGGGHRYGDGTVVYMRDSEDAPIANGKKYLLFLKNKPQIQSVWERVNGGQGQYELNFDLDLVRPSYLEFRNPLVEECRNMRIIEFLKSIREAIKKN